ncbi:MAG: caspase family protein, partial [Myxococcota bacterium]
MINRDDMKLTPPVKGPLSAPAGHSTRRGWRQALLALPLALNLTTLGLTTLGPAELLAAPARPASTSTSLKKGETQTPTQTLRRYALIIGANLGGPSRPPLKYAHTDAQAFARVLEEMGGVGAADRMLLLEPTRASLDQNLKALSQRLKAEQSPQQRSELVLYYSGHSDETGIMLGSERWSYPEIRQALDTLPADVRIAILDSCSSGALIRTKGGTRKPPFMVDASSSVKGYAFLTSSAEDEAAQESERLKGSFFTHALVTGLRGAADASRDGRVTLHEAYQFAFYNTLDKTRATAAGPQHPGYDIRLVGSGDLVLTDTRSTGAGVMLDPNLVGDLYVRDGDGHLVAELKKAAGTALELAFAPGPYRLTLVTEGQVLEATLTLRGGERVSLTETRFAVVPMERTTRRGAELEPAPLAPGEERSPVLYPLSELGPAESDETEALEPQSELRPMAPPLPPEALEPPPPPSVKLEPPPAPAAPLRSRDLEAKLRQAEREAREAQRAALEIARETVQEALQEAQEAIREALENAREEAREAQEDAAEEAREAAEEAAEEAREAAEEAAEEAREAAEERHDGARKWDDDDDDGDAPCREVIPGILVLPGGADSEGGPLIEVPVLPVLPGVPALPAVP